MAGRPKNVSTFALVAEGEDAGGAAPVVRVPIVKRLDAAKRGQGKTFGIESEYSPEADRALLTERGPDNADACRVFLSIGNGRGSTKIVTTPSEIATIVTALRECVDFLGDRPGEAPLAGIVRRTFTAARADDGKIECSFKVSEAPMTRTIDFTLDESEDLFRWLNGFETSLRRNLAKWRSEAKVEIPEESPEYRAARISAAKDALVKAEEAFLAAEEAYLALVPEASDADTDADTNEGSDVSEGSALDLSDDEPAEGSDNAPAEDTGSDLSDEIDPDAV